MQNAIERAVILSPGETLEIDRDFLPFAEPDPAATADQAIPDPAPGAAVLSLEAMERRYILAVLERTQGVIEGANGAAKLLALHPSTLRARMKRFGINRP